MRLLQREAIVLEKLSSTGVTKSFPSEIGIHQREELFTTFGWSGAQIPLVFVVCLILFLRVGDSLNLTVNFVTQARKPVSSFTILST